MPLQTIQKKFKKKKRQIKVSCSRIYRPTRCETSSTIRGFINRKYIRVQISSAQIDHCPDTTRRLPRVNVKRWWCIDHYGQLQRYKKDVSIWLSWWRDKSGRYIYFIYIYDENLSFPGAGTIIGGPCSPKLYRQSCYLNQTIAKWSTISRMKTNIRSVELLLIELSSIAAGCNELHFPREVPFYFSFN